MVLESRINAYRIILCLYANAHSYAPITPDTSLFLPHKCNAQVGNDQRVRAVERNTGGFESPGTTFMVEAI